jgi:hypothetical protein
MITQYNILYVCIIRPSFCPRQSPFLYAIRINPTTANLRGDCNILFSIDNALVPRLYASENNKVSKETSPSLLTSSTLNWVVNR